MKPKSLFYLQGIFSLILLCTLLFLYPQNVRYKQENRKLILENDSILAVNQVLHQQLGVKATDIEQSERDLTREKKAYQ
jgi:hypothetical protein